MNNIGRLGILGGGKMAQAMLKGLISASLIKAESVIASVHPSDKPSLEALKAIGAETTFENKTVVDASDVVFLSVKPQVMPTVLKDIKSSSRNKLFISIAMGFPLETIEQNLDGNARIIRAMPNTPALVNSGCTVIARGSMASDDDVLLSKKLFEAVGTCEEVEEKMLDIVTALSGSGPAYVFVMIEALADGAVEMGLPRDLAYRLASQTVLGSGHMVRDSGMHPGQLKDNVTSPGGSTAAGLQHLEKSAFRSAVAGAVVAATLKCREMSQL